MPQQALQDIWFWLGVLLAASFVLVVVLLVVRKIMMRGLEGDGGAEPFTLAELRRMHDEGQLSDAEFERAKKGLIARSLSALDSESDVVDENDSDNDLPGDEAERL